MPFANGTDYVPRDMPAFIHKGERIIPAAQNLRDRSAGGGGGRSVAVTYAPVIQVDSRSDRAQVLADVQRAVSDGHRDMLEFLKAQGVTG